MKIKYETLKREIVEEVVDKKLKCPEAALQLGVSVRTVRSYVHRFLEFGPEGLKDRRKGNYHKLTQSQEAAIVTYKHEKPARSARLIRDRLRLDVSEEAVRLILVKHHMNGRCVSTEGSHGAY